MTRFELKLSALALGAALICSGAPAFAQATSAQAAPVPPPADTFPLYLGNWVGEGTLVWKSDGSKERMKCTAVYAQPGAPDELSLKFDCKSDNYTIILDGVIESDSKGSVKGQWSERSRNIGGAAIGQAKEGRIRLRIESSAFGANLQMGVKADKQQVAIKFSGAGEEADTELLLKKAK
ncbi:hypothetical protein IZ6_12490 [Terrihabitans soli]|uniref:Uncharacterized protein n=1 Tax=Terrihabitans soli TaxID=708113 RepID=A0A6S6QJN0_9HYPH|nr:hypothetical protein [Terrihabitans soli]BCJ90514.1 hypothetical protein IZ6_12490 [Terrihabitans soli]